MDALRRTFRARLRRPAFTLVEAMVSIVVVGLILVAALTTLGATARARHVASSTSQGPDLARQLMSEILATAFVDPEDPAPSLGTDDGESSGPPSRSPWDDVDDYDGLVEAPLVYKDDSPVPGAVDWSRSVTVRYADPRTLADTGPSETGLKRITVTATAPDGAETVISALRSRYGAVEQPPATDTTYVTWVGVEINLNDDAETVSSGVNLPNHAVGGP